MRQFKFNPTLALYAFLVAGGLFLAGCGSDLFVDPAGACTTCTYQSGRVIQACADGDGNITVEEAGVDPVTSDNNLLDFSLPHEASGATCQ